MFENLDATGQGTEEELRREMSRQIATGRRNKGRFVMSLGSLVTWGDTRREGKALLRTRARAREVRMKIAIVSDEISSDFSTAVEIGTDWGIGAFEIRGLCSGRVPYISQRDIERVLQVKEEFGIEISAISPGAFKLPVDSAEAERHLEDMLPRTYELARRLGSRLVIIFGFHKPKGSQGKYPSRVVELLREAAEDASREGILLALENEPGCWVDTGRAAAEIVKKIGHPKLRLNWDPCNSLSSGGNPYSEEYEELKDLMAHLHIKDLRAGRYVPAGEGDVDWRGQLGTLIRDGFDGYYTVETHYGP